MKGVFTSFCTFSVSYNISGNEIPTTYSPPTNITTSSKYTVPAGIYISLVINIGTAVLKVSYLVRCFEIILCNFLNEKQKTQTF